MVYITEPEPTLCGVLHVVMPEDAKSSDDDMRVPESRLEEAANLCEALPVKLVWRDKVKLNKISSRTLLGKGKVEELAELMHEKEIDLLVVNANLSPTQQRNLEVALKVKVIDRTGLILEIFADRAQTHAGRLQVEMAMLQYQANRLVRAWTHLERQRGGLGKTGGPGERQIELDRRMIRDQIDRVKTQLDDVEKTRALHRKGRVKSGLPVVALVGYTNAGKSTLFNAVSGADAFVKDMLFATLDPLMRKIKLNSGREVIFSDTVGFVSDLPHELVKAFHATLEEVVHADLLLHVHDASSDEAQMQDQDVKDVLESIGADKLPKLNIYNKQDLARENPELDHTWEEPDGVETAAATGEGVDKVHDAIEAFFAASEKPFTFKVPASEGRKLAWLQAHGEVTSMELDGDTYDVEVVLAEEDAAIFETM